MLDRTRDLAVPAPDTEFRRYKNRFHATRLHIPVLPGREPLT